MSDYDIHSAEMQRRRQIEPEPYTFVVICRDDQKLCGCPGDYVLATRQYFSRREDAEAYAETIARNRWPMVVEGRWHQMRPTHAPL